MKTLLKNQIAAITAFLVLAGLIVAPQLSINNRIGETEARIAVLENTDTATAKNFEDLKEWIEEKNEALKREQELRFMLIDAKLDALLPISGVNPFRIENEVREIFNNKYASSTAVTNNQNE